MAPRRPKAQAQQATRPGHGEFDAVADYYDYLMRAIPYGQWVDYVEALLSRHGLQARRVLDLCCGTGKVGSEMLRRGYEVYGADLSEKMVRHCRRQQPPLPAAVMDASALGLRSNSFDLVVSLYDSLNYILDPAKLACCFCHVHRILKPGAAFVFDMNTTYALAAGFFAQSNLGSGDPLEFEWRPQWDSSTRICRVDMRFCWRDGSREKVFHETHYQRAYEIEEIENMLVAAGFAETHIYHAYSFRPPSRWSDRIFGLAVKGDDACNVLD
ncbi:MAG: class I SAM-dependent methyltransferase [Armatimonadetes bacterium]|nr:class I SAM-dependent methyltransferase [Armatimonadota bacterium]